MASNGQPRSHAEERMEPGHAEQRPRENVGGHLPCTSLIVDPASLHTDSWLQQPCPFKKKKGQDMTGDWVVVVERLITQKE